MVKSRRLLTLGKNEQAWMLVEKMIVIFKTDDPYCKVMPSLPWGIGKCVQTDMKKKIYKILPYKLQFSKEEKTLPIVWIKVVAPPNETKLVLLPFQCPMEFPVKLQKTGLIPPEKILIVAEKKDFEWDLDYKPKLLERISLTNDQKGKELEEGGDEEESKEFAVLSEEAEEAEDEEFQPEYSEIRPGEVERDRGPPTN